MAWLSGWSYRKGLAIGSQTDLTDYQVRVLVGESPAVVGTNVNCEVCLPSFNDLRFTQSDGTTLLSYWIEEVSGVSPLQIAVVWVKVPSISANTPIFLYSGNASASAGSNGINTFLFFDDASTNRSSEYTIQGIPSPAGSGSFLWSSGGYYSLRVTSTGHFFAKINSLGDVKNIALHTEFYRETDVSNQQGGLVIGSMGYTRYITRAANRLDFPNVGSFSYTLPQSVWKKLMAAVADNLVVATWKNMDNTVIWNPTYTPSTSVNPGPWGFFGAYDTGAITRHRRFFARKFASPEPTVLYTFSLLAEYTAVPLSGYVPLPVQFQDLSTSSEIITGWNWDFGDGNTSVVQNPTHTYDAPGSYTVSLTASDGVDSATQTKSNYITVNATVADFTADSLTVPADSIVNFTDTSAGNITNWLWDFGGGVTSTDQNPSHVYTVADAYDVTLTVTDVVGTVTSITKTDYITCLLVPKFDVSATSGYSPLTVTFTESSLGSPTGWDWDFGDGKGHSTEANPTHTFVYLGKHTITLTITRDGVPPAILTKADYITVNTTATTTKLTFDTDDGRINSSPSTVILPSGQQFCFYSKFLTTGKESFSRITFVEPSFTVNVEAGSGTINGIPVNWNAGTLTAPANSYNIVYVTAAGVLGIGSNLTMNFLNDVILLAYVSSGNSSITRIDELEHTGNYIYVRKQILLGSEWVWDDYEILLNTGSEPICFYNSITGEIYLSYTKDSSSYVRTFKPEVDLTWEYLNNIAIASNVNITLKKDPENTAAPIGLGSGYAMIFQLNDGLFPLGASGFSFVDGDIHVFLPYILSSYLAYVVGDITYEFFTKSGDEYTIEASYTIDKYKSLDLEKRHRLWSGTLGVKYVGVRMKTTLYTQEYVTLPINYGSFEIYNFPDLTRLSEANYSVDTKDNRFELSLGSGYIGVFNKVAEYEETIDFESDTYSQIGLGSGYIGEFNKTVEYEETRDFESDTYSQIALGSGYATDFSVTNI